MLFRLYHFNISLKLIKRSFIKIKFDNQKLSCKIDRTKRESLILIFRSYAMSAYQVSDKQIHILAVTYYSSQWECSVKFKEDLGNVNYIIRTLVDANIRSVDTRYPDNASTEEELQVILKDSVLKSWDDVDYLRKLYKDYSVVQILKLVHNYEYQCLDWEQWDISKAKDICRDLKDKLIVRLDGYNESSWGL